MATEILLVRHGATEWSENGRHTGRTDVSLSGAGRAEAARLRPRLEHYDFAVVVTSPMQRARDTAAISGLGDHAEVDDRLREWDYGSYEGVTTAEIRETVPGWTVWTGPCPGGETAAQVGGRADAVLERLAGVDGTCAVFSHGHFSRVLIARWLGLQVADGRLFTMRTGTLNGLGYEREQRVLLTLNG